LSFHPTTFHLVRNVDESLCYQIISLIDQSTEKKRSYDNVDYRKTVTVTSGLKST
jgi:hypothetical protein